MVLTEHLGKFPRHAKDVMCHTKEAVTFLMFGDQNLCLKYVLNQRLHCEMNIYGCAVCVLGLNLPFSYKKFSNEQ
jgi:hypothetical protein